ncbi:hypothetical protein EG856_01065 [Mycoplasmopsis phocirhinis]|uniref:ECM-binding protein homolog n=1 Tax=Mycoplasmopsis phocirhinis TaxID=142650 RepID=A0A4P6MT68_9BACT|nr:hypothetical protein [Mycoplasmopsis phocirhinis]QBF34517.1 hypothetical protein EG856_01065 [Mycoplasmopsis phocirhinis]
MKKRILTTLVLGATAATTTAGVVATLELNLEKDIQPQISSQALQKKVGELKAEDINFYYKGKRIDPSQYGVTISSLNFDKVNGVGISSVNYNFSGRVRRRDISVDFQTSGFATAKDDLNDSKVVGIGDSNLTASHFVEKINELNKKAVQDQNEALNLAKTLIGGMPNQDQYNYQFSEINYDESENVSFKVKASYKLQPNDNFERTITIPASQFLAQKQHNENLANEYKELSEQVQQWINDNLGPEKYAHDVKNPLEKVKQTQDKLALPNVDNPPSENTIIAAKKALQEAFDKAKVAKAVFDLEQKQTQLRDYEINNLANNPNAQRVIEQALANFSRSNIPDEDVNNVAKYNEFIQNLDNALKTATQIQDAKDNFDEELKNKFQPSHFGVDNKTKDDYENRVQAIINNLNAEQAKNLDPQQAIKAYEDAKNGLAQLKQNFDSTRKDVIAQYEQALANLNTSKQAMDNIGQYAKLQKDIEDLVKAKNISVDKANNYANTTLENISEQTKALNDFNESIPAQKMALDEAKQNYDEALQRVTQLKDDPKYADFKADLETLINDQTAKIAQDITDKTIDVAKYNNAAAALQAILIKGAKDRFLALKSKTNKIINTPINNFDAIDTKLQSLSDDLSDKVAKSNNLVEIENYYDQLGRANDVANKQKEFANKFNEIVNLAAQDQYHHIKNAITSLMDPLKQEVLASNDVDFITQKINELNTQNFSQKVNDAKTKFNAVEAKINELNHLKDTEYANYEQAKAIIQDAVNKYNNTTLVSDSIDAQISDKNPLNTQNYDNIIAQLDSQKTKADEVKTANDEYNTEFAKVFGEANFVGYQGAKTKYDQSVEQIKQTLANALVQAQLNSAQIVQAYNNATQALKDAKEAIAKNKTIDDFNKKVAELNELKANLNKANNAQAYQNLVANIDQAIEQAKQNVDFNNNFARVNEDQIQEQIEILNNVKQAISTKQNAIDQRINLFNNPGKSEIQKLIANDIDKETTPSATNDKNLVKQFLNNEIAKAQQLIADVNANDYGTLDGVDAYWKAYTEAKVILDNALLDARKQIDTIDEAKHRLLDYEHNSQNVIPGFIMDWNDPKYDQIKADLDKVIKTEDAKWLPIARHNLLTVDVKQIQDSIDKIKQAYNKARLDKAKLDFDTEYNDIANVFQKPVDDQSQNNKYETLRNKIIEQMSPIKAEVDVLNVDNTIKYQQADANVNKVNELQNSLADIKTKANEAKDAFDKLQQQIDEAQNLINSTYTQTNNPKAYELINNAINDNKPSTIAAENVLDPQIYEQKTNALKQAIAQANEISEAKKAYETELASKTIIENTLPETQSWYNAEIEKIKQNLDSILNALNDTKAQDYVAKVKKAYTDAQKALDTLKDQIPLKSAQEKWRQALDKIKQKQKALGVDAKPQLKGLNKQIQDLIDQSSQDVKHNLNPNPYQNVSIDTIKNQTKLLDDFANSVEQKADVINEAEQVYQKAKIELEKLIADDKYKTQHPELEQIKTQAENAISTAQNNESVNAKTYNDQAQLIINSAIDQANERFNDLVKAANELIKTNDLANNQRYDNINQTLRDKIAELQANLPNKTHDTTKDKVEELKQKINLAQDQYDALNKAIEQAKINKAKADYEAKKAQLDNEINSLDEYPKTKEYAQNQISEINQQLVAKIAQLDADANTTSEQKIAAYKEFDTKLDELQAQLAAKKQEETNEAKAAYETKLDELNEKLTQSQDPSRKYIKDKLDTDKNAITNSITPNSTPKAYNDAVGNIDTALNYANEQFPIADANKAAVEAYDTLKQQVQQYLDNDLGADKAEYNKIRKTLADVKNAQDAKGSATNDPYPKANAANEAKIQLQQSLDEAKKQKTLIDAAKMEYDKQITLIDSLVTKPEYIAANQVDTLNAQKNSSQLAIQQAQNNNSIQASDYSDEVDKLKPAIQNAAVAIYNDLNNKVDELINNDNLGGKNQYQNVINDLNMAKQQNDANGTNNANPYETINQAYDNLNSAYNKALDDALNIANNQFNTDKAAAVAQKDATNDAYQSAKQSYENEINRLQGDVDSLNAQNDKNAKRKAIEQAIDDLAAAKTKFANDIAAMDAAKKAEYDNKVNELNDLASKLNAYPDAKRELLNALKASDEAVGRDTDGADKYPLANKAKQIAPNFIAQLSKLEQAITKAKTQTSQAAKAEYEKQKDALQAIEVGTNNAYNQAKQDLNTKISEIQKMLDEQIAQANGNLDDQRQAYEDASAKIEAAKNAFETAKTNLDQAKKDEYNQKVDQINTLINALNEYPDAQTKLRDALNKADQAVGRDANNADKYPLANKDKQIAPNFITQNQDLDTAINEAKQLANTKANQNYGVQKAKIDAIAADQANEPYAEAKNELRNKINEINNNLNNALQNAGDNLDKKRDLYEDAQRDLIQAQKDFENAKNEKEKAKYEAEVNKLNTLKNDLDAYPAIKQQLQNALDNANSVVGKNDSAYDSSKATADNFRNEIPKISAAINKALEDAKTQAEQNYNNAKQSADNESANTTDPSYKPQKDAYDAKLNQIQAELTTALNDAGQDPAKIRKAYEDATKKLNDAKAEFIAAKNSEQAQKNREYIELSKQVQTYLDSTLTSGYEDIDKTLKTVKDRTDLTSGLNKTPSLTQVQNDIRDLTNAFNTAKQQQPIRAQKLRDKNAKDAQYATALNSYNDPLNSNLKSYLSGAKTNAQTALDSVLNNPNSTTQQINTAYDTYNTALTNAINAASQALNEFDTKKREVQAEINKASFKTTLQNELNALKPQVNNKQTVISNLEQIKQKAIKQKQREDARAGAQAYLNRITLSSKQQDKTNWQNIINSNTAEPSAITQAFDQVRAYLSQMQNTAKANIKRLLANGSNPEPYFRENTNRANNNANTDSEYEVASGYVNSRIKYFIDNELKRNLTNQFDAQTQRRFELDPNIATQQQVVDKISEARTLLNAYNALGNLINTRLAGDQNLINKYNVKKDENDKTLAKFNTITQEVNNEITTRRNEAQSILNTIPQRLKDQHPDWQQRLGNPVTSNNNVKNVGELNVLIDELDKFFVITSSSKGNPETINLQNSNSMAKTNVIFSRIPKVFNGKYLYAVAKYNNNYIVSQSRSAERTQDDINRFTNNGYVFNFPASKAANKRNGEYHLETVIYSDNQNLTDNEVLSIANSTNSTNKAIKENETNNNYQAFNVMGAAEIVANNVRATFTYDKNINWENTVGWNSIIEKGTPTTVNISGFTTKGLDYSVPNLKIKLKGKARTGELHKFETPRFNQKINYSYNNKDLVHDLDLNLNSKNITIDNSGNLSFNFRVSDLKAGYKYEIEQINVSATPKNRPIQYTEYIWYKNQQNSNISYDQSYRYTENNTEVPAYIFSLSANESNRLWSLKYGETISTNRSASFYSNTDNDIDDAWITRIYFNSIDMGDFSKIFNYLISKVPNTAKSYSPKEYYNTTFQEEHLNLREKWIDQISQVVAEAFEYLVPTNDYSKIPNDTTKQYGTTARDKIGFSTSSIQLGALLNNNSPYYKIDNLRNNNNNNNVLYPIVGGQLLRQYAATDNSKESNAKLARFLNTGDGRYYALYLTNELNNLYGFNNEARNLNNTRGGYDTFWYGRQRNRSGNLTKRSSYVVMKEALEWMVDYNEPNFDENIQR